MQCVAGAMAAGATATGTRTWLVGRFGHLLTPRRRKAISAALIVGAVLSAGLVGPTP
jgi:hypothetical protein